MFNDQKLIIIRFLRVAKWTLMKRNNWEFFVVFCKTNWSQTSKNQINSDFCFVVANFQRQISWFALFILNQPVSLFMTWIKCIQITCKVKSIRTVHFHAVPFGREVCCENLNWLLLARWAVIAQWDWLWFYEKNNVYSSLTFIVIRLRFSYDHGFKNQWVYWVYRKVMNIFQKTKPNACVDHWFCQRITSRTSNRKKP
jgi:hypothetical protein